MKKVIKALILSLVLVPSLSGVSAWVGANDKVNFSDLNSGDILNLLQKDRNKRFIHAAAFVFDKIQKLPRSFHYKRARSFGPLEKIKAKEFAIGWYCLLVRDGNYNKATSCTYGPFYIGADWEVRSINRYQPTDKNGIHFYVVPGIIHELESEVPKKLRIDGTYENYRGISKFDYENKAAIDGAKHESNPPKCFVVKAKYGSSFSGRF